MDNIGTDGVLGDFLLFFGVTFIAAGVDDWSIGDWRQLVAVTAKLELSNIPGLISNLGLRPSRTRFAPGWISQSGLMSHLEAGYLIVSQ